MFRALRQSPEDEDDALVDVLALVLLLQHLKGAVFAVCLSPLPECRVGFPVAALMRVTRSGLVKICEGKHMRRRLERLDFLIQHVRLSRRSSVRGCFLLYRRRWLCTVNEANLFRPNGRQGSAEDRGSFHRWGNERLQEQALLVRSAFADFLDRALQHLAALDPLVLGIGHIVERDLVPSAEAFLAMSVPDRI